VASVKARAALDECFKRTGSASRSSGFSDSMKRCSSLSGVSGGSGATRLVKGSEHAQSNNESRRVKEKDRKEIRRWFFLAKRSVDSSMFSGCISCRRDLGAATCWK
jgi:hypothetical protein